jgi:hypothetical protein
MLQKNLYRLTDQANVELRRRAVGGQVALTERGAEYELLRGTIEAEAKVAVPARATSKPAD